MSFEVPGLWLPPLSAEQIQVALKFGENNYGTVEQISRPGFDIYDVFVKDVQVLVSIGTAFNRIAAYAGQAKRTGSTIDPTVIESINFTPLFKTHFMVRLISNHKRLSIMATDVSDGRPQNMEQPTVERFGPGEYKQMCFSPNPTTLAGQKGFEIRVPQFLGKFRTAQFVFDFREGALASRSIAVSPKSLAKARSSLLTNRCTAFALMS